MKKIPKYTLVFLVCVCVCVCGGGGGGGGGGVERGGVGERGAE